MLRCLLRGQSAHLHRASQPSTVAGADCRQAGQRMHRLAMVAGGRALLAGRPRQGAASTGVVGGGRRRLGHGTRQRALRLRCTTREGESIRLLSRARCRPTGAAVVRTEAWPAASEAQARLRPLSTTRTCAAAALRLGPDAACCSISVSPSAGPSRLSVMRVPMTAAAPGGAGGSSLAPAAAGAGSCCTSIASSSSAQGVGNDAV